MHKLLDLLYKHSDSEVRTAYVTRMLDAKRNRHVFFELMEAQGFEKTSESGVITSDGREITRARGENWILRKDIHAARLAESFAEKAATSGVIRSDSQRMTKDEGLASVYCPRCSEPLHFSKVCGSCKAGAAGLKYRYTCANCEVDFMSKEKL